MKVEIFDPEMCCSTGICGPAPDPVLIEMQATVEALRMARVQVDRYQLSRQPTAFTDNPVVYSKLLVEGAKALPLVAIDGALLVSGRYPSRAELMEALKLGT